MATILSSLDQDWNLLVRSTTARHALRTWAAEGEAILGTLSTLDDLLFLTKQGTDPADSDKVLAALARRAATLGDEVAARALLQCLAPGLCRLANKYGSRDAEIATEVIGYAYERIRTFPIERRPRAIAANILADTHQKMWRSRQRKRVETVALEEASVASTPVAEDCTAELLALVASAVKAGKLTREAAEIIVMTRVYDQDIATIADAEGIDPQTLRQRRRRAEARLTELPEVQAELADLGRIPAAI